MEVKGMPCPRTSAGGVCQLVHHPIRGWCSGDHVAHLDAEVELGRKGPGIWLSGTHPRASIDIQAEQGEGDEAPSRVQPWDLEPVSPPVSFPICKMG